MTNKRVLIKRKSWKFLQLETPMSVKPLSSTIIPNNNMTCLGIQVKEVAKKRWKKLLDVIFMFANIYLLAKLYLKTQFHKTIE